MLLNKQIIKVCFVEVKLEIYISDCLPQLTDQINLIGF